MSDPLRGEIETYFGESLRRGRFVEIYVEKTAVGECLIYESGRCRLRCWTERLDNNFDVGGVDAPLTVRSDDRWMSLWPMLDFLESRSNVDDRFDSSAFDGYDVMMRDIARRFDHSSPTLLTWFEPEGLVERMKARETYGNWQRKEIRRRLKASRRKPRWWARG